MSVAPKPRFDLKYLFASFEHKYDWSFISLQHILNFVRSHINVYSDQTYTHSEVRISITKNAILGFAVYKMRQ